MNFFQDKLTIILIKILLVSSLTLTLLLIGSMALDSIKSKTIPEKFIFFLVFYFFGGILYILYKIFF